MIMKSRGCTAWWLLPIMLYCIWKLLLCFSAGLVWQFITNSNIMGLKFKSFSSSGLFFCFVKIKHNPWVPASCRIPHSKFLFIQNDWRSQALWTESEWEPFHSGIVKYQHIRVEHKAQFKLSLVIQKPTSEFYSDWMWSLEILLEFSRWLSVHLSDIVIWATDHVCPQGFSLALRTDQKNYIIRKQVL